MIKVLIVDDSPVVRDYLAYILVADPDIEIIGFAKNGEEACDFVQSKKPDVITMDIHMPKMNGYEATRRIMESCPVPIVIVSASWEPSEVEKSFQCIDTGAVAILEKPRGIGYSGFEETTKNLIQTVKLMSEVKVIRRWPRQQPVRRAASSVSMDQFDRPGADIKIVAIGASTGGPNVVKTILSGLKKKFPVPIVLVQHISPGFLPGLTEWLDRSSELSVQVAAQGVSMQPGHVYIAPDEYHMGVTWGGRIVLSQEEKEGLLRPSVSYLFRSIAAVYGENAVGILLTGMGRDGAEELNLMKEKGAVTIAQDRESSIVFGMPGEAVKLGAAKYVLPPDQIVLMLEKIVAEIALMGRNPA